jgi:GDP-4-dehydro-6-deoxy-D-mannose reductase
MSIWLVTGGSGFLGRHLLDALRARDDPEMEVVALGRRRPASWCADRFISADLNDADGLARSLSAVNPEVVIHAAGATPPLERSRLYQANTWTTINLLDALRESSRQVRVVLVGSAAELGSVAIADLPVGEDYPCRPAGAYGLSKWLATCGGLAAGWPLEVVVARVFNLIGPGAPSSQVFGGFAARLAAGVEKLVVGPLDARRDFVDVRDVARALIVLAQVGQAGHVYHVGTGKSRPVEEGLAHLMRRAGRAIEIEVDRAAATRPGLCDSRADIRKIVAATNWRPVIPFEQSLDDLWIEAARQAGLPLTG